LASTTNPFSSPPSPTTAALSIDAAAADAAADAPVAAGLALFAQHCAACHGAKGTGDGIASYLLYPKPRDYTQGAFRITSTKTGLPTDDDLMGVLRRGMPGSAMPPWGHLSDTELQSLVAAVRSLAVEGKVEQLLMKNKTMKPDKARQIATGLMTPGPVVELPPRAADGSGIDLERGKMLFASRCAACHDIDGRGRNKRDLKDTSGYPVFARDFTQGIFKGGSEADAIARRIVVGMPGSPMPAGDLPPQDLWSLVEYVRSMVKPGAQQRAQQVMQSLRAARVTTLSDLSEKAEAWRQVEPTFVPLMPLWWRDERVEGVNVRAVHDGSQIAIELSWDDASEDDLPNRPQSFSDAAGIQLGADPNPPLFAMGAAGAPPVTIWYWKASRQREVASGGQASLDATYPNAATDPLSPWIPDDDLVFDAAKAVRNPVSPGVIRSAVEDLRAAGFGTLTALLGVKVQAAGDGSRTANGWRAVFHYPLSAAARDGAPPLVPGKSTSIALAVWDGSAGDRNGQKSVTIWHRLVLDP
jgi:DMSO reductase family type II enzyme heme b subunit